MADEQKDVERHHSFDGITEYDNRVPGWLNAMFVISTIWAVWYMGWYFLGAGKIGVEAFEQERAEILRAKLESGDGIPQDEDLLRQFSHDDQQIATGKEIFFGKGACTTCHGADGLGMAGVGPNLRDDNWLYGSDMLEMIETLQYGRPGGMPAQGSILSERDMIAVAAYLADWNRTAKANGQGYTKDGEKLLPIGY